MLPLPEHQLCTWRKPLSSLFRWHRASITGRGKKSQERKQGCDWYSEAKVKESMAPRTNLIRTSSSSKLWTSVHKVAEYNSVNKDVSRGHDSRRVVAAAFLAMQAKVSAYLCR
jgi:hypothetical protein